MSEKCPSLLNNSAKVYFIGSQYLLVYVVQCDYWLITSLGDNLDVVVP